MNRKNIILVVVLVVIVLVIGFVSHTGSSSSAVSDGNIKIGLIAPLSGDAATYGEPIQEGAQLALSELNARSDAKYKYTLVAEDGKCTGKDAASAAQKLVNVDKVDFIVGGACSGETLAVAPITEQAKVILLSPSASSPDITNSGPYTYRTVASDAEAGEYLGSYFKNKYSKIALLSEQTDYAQAIKQKIITKYTSLGGTVVFDESFQSNATDFKTELTRVKQSGAEAFFINPQTEANFTRVITQSKDLGLTMPLYGILFTSDAVAANPAAKDVTMFDVPNVASDKFGQLFSQKFFAKYNKNPNYPYFAASAYEDINLIAHGIEKNGPTPDGVKGYFDNLGDYNSSIGTFHFDQNGDAQGFNYLIKRVVNGHFVPVNN